MEWSADGFSLAATPFHPVASRLPWFGRRSRRMGFRVLVCVSATWGALLILSLASGTALGHRVQLPFLLDLAPLARYLVATPLFLLAEPAVDAALRPAVAHLRENQVLPEEAPRFEGLLARLVRRRDALAPNAVLLVLALIPFAGNEARGLSSWIGPGPIAGLTAAGWWQVHVAAAVFRFLGFRWLYRMVLWAGFLGGLSRMRLTLMPTHPDSAGGLEFLGLAQARLGILFGAAGAVLGSIVGDAILYGRASVWAYTEVMGAYVTIAVAVVLGPLLVFVPKLVRAKRLGQLEYGALADRYVSSFDVKWVRGRPDEALLGTADIQALNDLGGAFKVVREMRPVPISGEAFLIALGWPVLPLLPLVLLAVPAEELLKTLLRILA